jgi:hypothetical protein
MARKLTATMALARSQFIADWGMGATWDGDGVAGRRVYVHAARGAIRELRKLGFDVVETRVTKVRRKRAKK